MSEKTIQEEVRELHAMLRLAITLQLIMLGAIAAILMK